MRRHLALAAAALTLAVLVAGCGSADRGTKEQPEDASATAWQTLARAYVRVEVPGSWAMFKCGGEGRAGASVVYGADRSDACDLREMLAFYPSATFNAMTGPGVIERDHGTWAGYVTLDDYCVSVVTADRDLTRRVLASVRSKGEPRVRADRWVTGTVGGRTYDVPSGWGVGAGDGAGYLVRPHDGGFDDEDGAETIDRSHYRRYRSSVEVIAPTRAVADLVLGSLRP